MYLSLPLPLTSRYPIMISYSSKNRGLLAGSNRSLCKCLAPFPRWSTSIAVTIRYYLIECLSKTLETFKNISLEFNRIRRNASLPPESEFSFFFFLWLYRFLLREFLNIYFHFNSFRMYVTVSVAFCYVNSRDALHLLYTVPFICFVVYREKVIGKSVEAKLICGLMKLLFNRNNIMERNEWIYIFLLIVNKL